MLLASQVASLVVGAVILTAIVGLLIDKSPESEGRSETKDTRRP